MENIVKKKMKGKNCSDLLAKMKKKIDSRKMSDEHFEIKPYILKLQPETSLG